MNKLSLITAIMAGFFCLCPIFGIQASSIIVPDDYEHIQMAIDAAAQGDTILVRDGVYTGPFNRGLRLQGKAIALMSENGPEQCIIDCQQQSKGIFVQAYEGNTTVIAGFTIANGRSSIDGGGIYIINASPIIRNCIIQNCHSNNDGGGISLENSFAEINNCKILRNTAGQDGGGMYLENSDPVVFDCVFSANTAINGGGLYIDTSIYLNPAFFNCLIERNTSSEIGGGIFITRSQPRFYNLTLSGNHAGIKGGGMALYAETNPIFYNSIIFANTPEETHIDSSCSPTITYCLIIGSFPGDGNIHADPLFYSGIQGEYYLSNIQCGQNQDSPCLNSGYLDASENCIALAWEEICLSTLTTRTDHVVDQLVVDMGYHYPTTQNPPTPTPVPECPETGLTLEMPFTEYYPGDLFSLTATLCNATPDLLVEHAVMVALEIDGLFWLAPSWRPSTEGLNFYRMDIETGESTMGIIDEFTWPEIPGGGFFNFWGAILTPDLLSVVGFISGWTVSY